MIRPLRHVPAVHLNPHVKRLKPSATVAINDLSNELKKKGRDIFKFGLGQSPFPVPESVVESLRRNAHQKDYLPVKGLRKLQETVAEHHMRNFGIKAEPEDVLIGPGSKELMFLLQLTYYGDLVIRKMLFKSFQTLFRCPLSITLIFRC